MKAFPSFLISFFLLIFSPYYIFSQTTELWGLTYGGGTYGGGVIFKADANGDNDTMVMNMGFIIGIAPLFVEPCFASNGKMYGVTQADGEFGRGILYEFDPLTKQYSVKYNFGGNGSGTSPYGSLVQGINGELYGATYSGGNFDKGILYKFNLSTNTFTKLRDLNDSTGYGIHGRLLVGSNGKIYGGTPSGGPLGKGVLFEYDPGTDSLISIHHFDGLNGAGLFGSLMQATNRKIYGMTIGGGVNGSGTLFYYDLYNDSFSKLFDFADSMGTYPRGSLIEGTTGKLYGMTNAGGTSNLGVLFQFDTATSQFSKKIDFDGANKGGYPYGSLIQAANGNLYGLTSNGGANGVGIIFEYNLTNDSFTKKVDFNGPANGSYPYGSMKQWTDGKLYGMTSGGGSGGAGTIFSYNIVTDTLIQELSFREATGLQSTGSLVQLSNGKMYGMTSNGGVNWKGVLFEMDPQTNVYQKKIDFNGADNGQNPYETDLMVAENGKIYGTTREGGVYNRGVLFEYDPQTATMRKLVDFDPSANSSGPQGRLLQASDGKLYGTIRYGGNSWGGMLYAYDLQSDTFYIVHHFGANSGDYPTGYLIETDSGLLYGMVRSGMNYPSYSGAIFSFDLQTLSYNEHHVFNGADGRDPEGGLLQADNGHLYGMTYHGGVYNDGVIFEFDPDSGLFHLKHSFNQSVSTGYNPFGSLIQARNGRLYGMTSDDGYNPGANPGGMIFEFDPTNDSFTVKFSAPDVGGSRPRGDLLEICFPNEGTDTIITCDQYTWIDSVTYTSDTDSATFTLLNSTGCDSVVTLHLRILRSSYDTLHPVACNAYTSPSGKYTWTTTNTYLDTLVNQQGCDSILTVNLTVNYSSYDTLHPVVCYEYTSPSGKNTWTTSNTYQDTLVNQFGCDSVLTINLTINNSSYDTLSPVVCYQYTSPSGKYIWTNSNTYQDTLVNQYGCDSVLTIFLTVNSSNADSIYPDACFSYTSPSGKYTWNTSGIYLDTLVNQQGCDSFLIIFLTIDTVDITVSGVSPTFTANVTGATYRWMNCATNYSAVPGATNRTFTATTNGTYAVEITLNTCTDTSACVLVYNIGLPENETLNFLLYPNPNTGDFYIDYAGDLEALELIVFNSLGQLVPSHVIIESNRIRVHIDHSGLYTIRLNDRSNGKSGTSKVIVE